MSQLDPACRILSVSQFCDTKQPMNPVLTKLMIFLSLALTGAMKAYGNEGLIISEVLTVDYKAGQPQIGIQVSQSKSKEMLGKILRERIRYTYPAFATVAQVVEEHPGLPVEIWYQTKSLEKFVAAYPEMAEKIPQHLSSEFLIQLSGSKADILRKLEFAVVDEDLDTLEVQGNRLVFVRKARDLRPAGLATLRGTKDLGLPIVQWMLISDAFRRSIKPALIAVGWIRRGTQATQVALMSSPAEKVNLPVALVEIASVIVLEVISRKVISHLEYKLTKEQAHETLLKLIQEFTRLDGKTDEMSASLRAHYALEISQQMSEMVFLTNSGLFKDYNKYQSQVIELILKMRQLREQEASAFSQTFFFTKPFERQVLVEDRNITRFEDPMDKKARRFAEAYHKRDMTPRIWVPTLAERVRSQLDTFMIRVPHPHLREYQKFRKAAFEKMGSYDSSSSASLNLRIDLEQDLRDAYYLYRFRDDFDMISNEAVLRLGTPQAEKNKEFFDWLYHSQPSILDVLREDYGKGSLAMFYGRQSLGITVKPSTWFDDLSKTKRIPDNAADILMLHWSFLEKCLEDPNLNHEGIRIMRDIAKRKLDWIHQLNLKAVSNALIEEMRSRWNQLYIQAGVGLSTERYLELTQPSESIDFDEMDFGMFLQP